MHLFRQYKARRSKLYIVCSDFFQKVRAHSFRCSFFSSSKRSAGLRLDEMGALDWCIFFVNIVQKRCNLNGLRRFFFLKINEGYTEIGESKTWLCHDWHQIIVSNHFSCFPLFGTTLAPRHSTAYLQPCFDMRDVSALKSSGDC